MTKDRNVHIGQRVRSRRIMLGMSQRQLARSVGVKYQQVQKYEKGTSGPDAARLALLGRALRVGADWLLGGPEPSGSVASSALPDIDGRQHLALLRAWRRISHAESRSGLLELVVAIAAASEPDSSATQ